MLSCFGYNPPPYQRPGNVISTRRTLTTCEEERPKWSRVPTRIGVNMASIQEPAVQLAQRLASNEKPVRTKAVKKLRIYINVRSHVAEGGFAGDELLKLWKGLFYCLWMQDKPLLQEELSKQISTLIHSFQDIDGQLLYLESFLQTFKREWTGIDRLRMDKFFQLVRFMFRETFKILKRNNWESCVVARFLELLTAQLLQSSSGAPSGLQYHVLDLYMTELAAVGSAELTADQNLIFIEPFCKTAAKTKDRALFSAICNSMLSTIIDQAPFAIEDLMKELKAPDTSDSGQASEEDDGKLQGTEKQINGSVSNNEEEEDVEEEDAGDDDDDEEDLPESCDEDIGPVLQFDYTALADKLFALASRRGTPSRNRQRLYKIIKVLRDLNEGIFPQDEYPEEVSTDEDDDMFGSRKRIKRGRGCMGETDEREPAAKNSKGKKKKTGTINKQNEESGKDDNEPADLTTNDEKKKRKKKKTGKGGHADGEGNADRSEQEQTLAQAENVIQENEGSLEGPKADDLEKEVVTQSTLSTVKVTEAAPPEGRSETLLLSEAKKIPTVVVTEETSRPAPCEDKQGSEQLSKKGNLKSEVTEEQQPPVKEPGVGATASGKKKRTKQTHEVVAESQVNTAAKIVPATTLTKKKKKGLKAENNLNEVEVNGVSKEAGVPSTCEDSEEGGPTDEVEKPTILSNKKTKKNNLEADEGATVEAKDQSEVEENPADADVTSGGKEASLDAAAVPLKMRKGKQRDATLEESPVVPLNKKRKKTLKESKTPVEEEGVAVKSPRGVDAETEITMATPTKKKKKKIAAVKEQTQFQVVGGVDAELPLGETQEVSSCKKAAKKKRKIPVVFEYEDDELEAAAWKTTLTNGLKQVQTKPDSDSGEPSTHLHTKKCKKALKTSSGAGSDDLSFQSNATVPTPLYCKTPGSCSKKKIQTPKSESKKVTFGLKNNKTAEFRKTDRSLLVTPDGPSRVPFDPEQKPKFGVLKSTPTRLPASKTPKAKKIGLMRSTPKRRPSAADFF